MASYRGRLRAPLAYGMRPCPASLLPPPPEGTLHLPGGVPLGQIMTLVVSPLTLGHGQLDLDLAVLKVQLQRHQCQATLRCLTGKPVDFLAVQQQLARAPGLVVCPCPLRVLGDVHAMEPQLTVGELAEPVGERGPPGTQRLHLGPGEHKPRLDDVLNVIIVPGSPVTGDDRSFLPLCHSSRMRWRHARR